jgi:hypothetical protein
MKHKITAKQSIIRMQTHVTYQECYIRFSIMSERPSSMGHPYRPSPFEKNKYVATKYSAFSHISFSTSSTVQSSKWVQSHYCPCWLRQQRCKPYLQVQVKNSLVVRLCDVVAQYSMCEGCSISLLLERGNH